LLFWEPKEVLRRCSDKVNIQSEHAYIIFTTDKNNFGAPKMLNNFGAIKLLI
jgi:hypothetical protein